MSGSNVYVVFSGEIYEGGYVESVHATHEGALAAVRAFLADEEERNRESDFDHAEEFRWKRTGNDRWANCIDFIRIDVHEVKA